MNDDFNTAIVIAGLFEAVRIINSVNAGSETISASDLETLKKLFKDFISDILGLKEESSATHDDTDGLMQFIIKLRGEAKSRKDFATSDEIRDELGKLGFSIKDTKDGATWEKS
jgi:cysteinyl-tRNA synthetase